MLREAGVRATEDRQRQIDEEHAKARRKVAWDHAMRVAEQRATEAYYAAFLDKQVEQWRRANELRTHRAK